MKTLLVEVLIIVIVGLLSVVEGLRLHFKGSIQLYDILGPGLYNVGIGSIIIIAGLIYFISQQKEVRHIEKQSAGKDLKVNREYQKMMISVIFAMVVYIFLMDLIGYLLASVVFFLLINRIVGFRSWLTNLGVTILMTASSYIIFVTCLGMIFPRGILIPF
jgi:putative tricarboxylic transport membrane protein